MLAKEGGSGRFPRRQCLESGKSPQGRKVEVADAVQESVGNEIHLPPFLPSHSLALSYFPA